MSPEFAASIGYIVAAILALFGASVLLGLMVWVTLLLGTKLSINLRRIYCLSVITYWLPRVEREGWRVFPKCDPAKATGGAE